MRNNSMCKIISSAVIFALSITLAHTAAAQEVTLRAVQNPDNPSQLSVESSVPGFAALDNFEPNQYMAPLSEEPVVGRVKKAAGSRNLKHLSKAEKQELKREADDAHARIDAEKEKLSAKVRGLGIAADKIHKGNSIAANVSFLERITPAEAKLLRDNGVDLQPVPKMSVSLADSAPLIGAPIAWQHLDPEGYPTTGRGISVGIIDTGVDFTHPAFGSCTAAQFSSGQCARVPGGKNFLTPGALPIDDGYHGTHVAGIVGGALAPFKGIAPDVQLYAIKVCSGGGSCTYEAILGGIEYALDPNQDGDFSDHLDVINLSLGGAGNPDDVMSLAIDRAVEAGIVAIVAAGNTGPTAESIKSPGTARKAITVGATFPRTMTGGRFIGTLDDIASFSSRGPVVWNNGASTLNKPDLVAPGVMICAAESSAAAGYAECAAGYIPLSGTSMATPHVAGAAALLLQAYPAWTPALVLAALTNTAVQLKDPATGLPLPLAAQGAGRISVHSAIAAGLPGLAAELPAAVLLAGPEQSIKGTAAGADFASYVLTMSKVNSSEPAVEVGRGTTAVVNGVLATLDARNFASTEYLLTLTVYSASSSLRAYSSASVRNTFISSPISLTTATAEERQVFGIKEKIIVRGNAQAIGMTNYTLSVCAKPESLCANTPFSLSDGGASAVVNGVLGEFDPALIPGVRNGLYEIKLNVFRSDGAGEEAVALVTIDKDLRPGFPKPFSIIGAAANGRSLLHQPQLHDMNGDGKTEWLFSYGDLYSVRGNDLVPLPGWPRPVPDGDVVQVPMSVGDLDGDGRTDLLALGFSNRYAYRLSGTSLPVIGKPRSSGAFWSTFSARNVADLDGDGMAEVINSELWPLDIYGAAPEGWSAATNPTPPGSLHTYWSSSNAVGDIDRDGSPEVVAVSAPPAARLYVFSSQGRIKWSQPLAGAGSPSLYESDAFGTPVLADLNGDGYLDVVVYGREGPGQPGAFVYGFTHTGTPLPGFPVKLTATSAWGAVSANGNSVLAVGNVEGDAAPEIVLPISGCLVVLRSNGAISRNICRYDTGFSFYSVALANLDNDPESEIIAPPTMISGYIYGRNALYWLFTFNGDGTVVSGFPKPMHYLPDSWHFPVVDIDGDGKNELVTVIDEKFYVYNLEACTSTAEDWPMEGRTARHNYVYEPGTRLACGVSAPPPTPTPTATPTPTPAPTGTPTPTPTPAPAPTPGNFTLAVNVTVNGSPLAGAQVVLTTSQGEVVKHTSPNGLASFGTIAGPTAYTVKTSAPGYAFPDNNGTLSSNTVLFITGDAQQYTITVLALDRYKYPLTGVYIHAGSLGVKTTGWNGEVSFSAPYGTNYSISPLEGAYGFPMGNLSGTVYGNVIRVVLGEQMTY